MFLSHAIVRRIYLPFCAALLIGVLIYAFGDRLGLSPKHRIETSFKGVYSVSLRAHAQDEKQTDVFIIDTASDTERLFLTLPDIDRNRYHQAEFVDGYLYVIRRTENPETNPLWTDQLWSYDGSGHGTRLYAYRGLSFRVSGSANQIAILYADDQEPAFEEQILIITDLQGDILRRLRSTDLEKKTKDERLSLDTWDNAVLWFHAGQEALLTDIYSLDTAGSGIPVHYPIIESLKTTDVSLDPVTKQIAYSTYVVPEYEGGVLPFQTVSMYVYDLITREKHLLFTTSTAVPLAPAWLDNAYIEYNDPRGNGMRATTGTMAL